MSLLQEIEQHGLADCEFNRTLLPDEISINLHFADVQSVDDSLTNDEARQILQLIKNDHDATIGINWIVIEAWIGYFRSI